MVRLSKAVFSSYMLPQAQSSFFNQSLAKGNQLLCASGLRF